MSHSFIVEKSASSFLTHHFSQAVHSQSTHTHTQTHTNTVLNLITACTGGGVCFSSGGDRAEGRTEGITRSRLSLYLHEQRASINSPIRPSWWQLQSDCARWRLCDANEVEVLDPSGSHSPCSSGFGRDAATLWTSSSLPPLTWIYTCQTAVTTSQQTKMTQIEK